MFQVCQATLLVQISSTMTIAGDQQPAGILAAVENGPQMPSAQSKRRIFASVAKLIGLQNPDAFGSPTSKQSSKSFDDYGDGDESLSDNDTVPSPLLSEVSELESSRVLDCQGKSQQVKFLVTKKERNSSTLREQGDLKYYTNDELEKRACNHDSPKLRDLFQQYFDQLAKGGSTIGPRAYKFLYTKLYWKLCTKGKKEECEQLAAAEWDAETQGKGEMTFEQFYDSMFTTVDLWCSSSSEDAYVAYSQRLFGPIMSSITGNFENVSALNREQSFAKQVTQVFSEGEMLSLIKESEQRVTELKDSGRREDSASWYALECQRLFGIAMKPVSEALSSNGFGMKKLSLKGLGIKSILPLLDVLRLNTQLEELDLANNAFSSTDLQLLFLVLQTSRSLKSLDISGNPVCTSRTVGGLRRLLIRNTSIWKVAIRGTIPAASCTKVVQQADYNYHCNNLTREDYFFFKSAFATLDRDNSGTVDKKELMDYLRNGGDMDVNGMLEFGGKSPVVLPRKDSKRGASFSLKRNSMRGRASKSFKGEATKVANAQTFIKAAKRTEYRSQARAEAMIGKMMSKYDANGDAEFSLYEFLHMFYNTISPQVIEKIAKRYESSPSWLMGGASLADLEEVFEKYDTDGSGDLSWEELKTGILEMPDGEALWQRCEPHLHKYDLNNDQSLSLEEFVLLVAGLEEAEAS